MCLNDLVVARALARNRLLAMAAGMAVVLPVAGCGEDEDEPPTAPAVTGAETGADETAPGTEAPEDEPAADPVDDEDAITETLDRVLTGTNPAVSCGTLVTERFLVRSYGSANGCKAAQKDLKPADDARVEQVVVQPDSVAQAQARPKGGIYDGQRLRAELVLDGGIWKLDSLRSNVPVGP